MDHRTAFEEPDGDVTQRDFRHGNPIALMILAEWVEKRDREDPDVEHRFRLVRG